MALTDQEKVEIQSSMVIMEKAVTGLISTQSELNSNVKEMLVEMRQ